MPRRDMQWIILFLIFGVMGLTVFIQYYDRAQPAASLNFRFTRNEAFDMAEDYVEALGHDTSDYQSAQIFGRSGLQQVFLERTLGLAETNHLSREWLSIWYWHVRWFKPLEKEELRVRLDPDGRVVAFEHRILESDPGANLAQDEARTIAETYLTEVQGFRLPDYEPIQASSNKRPERTDHTFTYRKNDFTVGDDGHYRLSVTVQGDQIGSFVEYLKVPETFSRNYSEIRSRANLLASIATVFWFALGIAMIVVLMKKYRQNALQWHSTLFIGILVAAASLIGQINGYPITLFGYDTTQSSASFWLTLFSSAIFGPALIGGIICLVGAVGGAAAQDISGWRNPIAGLSWKSLRTVSFARSALIGYGLAFAQLGYVTLFYIFGQAYLGVWSPASMTQYSNTYSTFLPWIYPLLVGLVASTLEEFFFRLLAISLLLRWTGKRWFAVVFPAVVWAFLHANYAQEPIYIRGLEITVVGIVLGMVFLRYGIWTTIISHYVYNAFLGVYPMVQSDSLYFKISGILVVAVIFIPTLPAIYKMLTGREEPEPEPEMEPEPNLPEAVPEPAPPKTPPEEPIVRKTPDDYLFTSKQLITVGIMALIALGLYFGFKRESSERVATKLSVTRTEAIALADSFRQHLNIQLEGYDHTAWFSTDYGSTHFAHLRRNTSRANADSLGAFETSAYRWNVRWFKPLEKEELYIRVDGRGNIKGISHLIPESQPGDSLETEAAQKIAEIFLADHFNRDVTDTTRYKRLEARLQKREARIDHHFVWERTDIKVADGEFRVSATIHGSQIGSAGLRYKAPEEFLRKMHERGAKHAVYSTLSTIVVLTTIVLAIIYFLRAYRKGDIRWRPAILLSLLIGLGQLVSKVNELPGYYRKYGTTKALSTFLTGEIISNVMGLIGVLLIVTLIIALGEMLFRTQRPKEMQPADWLDVLRLKIGSPTLWAQAIFMVLCWMAIDRGLSALSSYTYRTYLIDYLTTSGGAPGGINTFIPALNKLAMAIPVIPMALFGIFAFLLTWQRSLRKPWLLVLLFVIAVFVKDTIVPAKDLYHFGFIFALKALRWTVLLILILKIFKYNLLVYATFFWSGLFNTGKSLSTLGHDFYYANGIILMIASFIPIAFALAAYRKQPTT